MCKYHKEIWFLKRRKNRNSDITHKIILETQPRVKDLRQGWPPLGLMTIKFRRYTFLNALETRYLIVQGVDMILTSLEFKVALKLARLSAKTALLWIDFSLN